MKNETTAELTPCPFCGAMPEHQVGVRIFDNKPPSPTVWCDNKECPIYRRAFEPSDWEKRVGSTSQIAALRSALESIRGLPNGKSHTRAIGIAIKALAGQGIDRI